MTGMYMHYGLPGCFEWLVIAIIVVIILRVVAGKPRRARVCGRCGQVAAMGDRFCARCGQRLRS